MATMDQDLNSFLEDRDDEEEIRVFMAEEPKIEVTDNLAMSIQMDRASEPSRWRNGPAAKAVRETERPPHRGPPLSLFATSPYHKDLSDH